MFSLIFEKSASRRSAYINTVWPCVFNWQPYETFALLMCVSLLFFCQFMCVSVCVCVCMCVCVRRSLAVNANTTHAGRAVIVVALDTTSRPGWQEPSTLDISARVRRRNTTTDYTLEITHSGPPAYGSSSTAQAASAQPGSNTYQTIKLPNPVWKCSPTTGNFSASYVMQETVCTKHHMLISNMPGLIFDRCTHLPAATM